MEMDSSQKDNVGEIDNTESNVKFHYQWKINNFSDFINNKKIDMLKSPLISTKTQPKYYFKIFIKACKKSRNLHMGLLAYNSTAWEVRYSFSFLNSNLDKNTNINVFNLNNFGWLNVVGNISEIEKFIMNNKITILCEIEIDMNSKCNKHPSDINIIINDKKFFVHKNILTNSSNVFDAMLKHDMKENQENLIEIKDIDSVIFHKLLQYIYLKKDVSIDNERIKLLAAADKYAIEGLKNICENKLCENITLTNVFEYLKVADMYTLTKLKKETIDFIKVHKKQLVEKKLIHSIADLPKDLLIEVFGAT